MAEYQAVIVNSQGKTWDVTEWVSTLIWSGSIKRVSRSVEVVMVAPNDGSLSELPCELGNELRFWCDGRTRSRGNIVTRGKAIEGVATTLTVLDRGRFLVNNEGWYTFRGAAPEEAVQALCGDFGIPVITLAATGTAVSQKYSGVTLGKIVDGLYTLAARQNGRCYLSRFNSLGELEMVEKPEAVALELASGKNLQSLRVTEDTSKLRNTVEIYSQTGVRVRTASDAKSVVLYGQFQHILTQRDGKDAGAEVQAYLEDNGLQQTMTVECLGDPELISGSVVLLRANTTGVTGLYWIDSDTRIRKNGQYFCRLSLNFRSLTNEVEAGQEVQESRLGRGGLDESGRMRSSAGEFVEHILIETDALDLRLLPQVLMEAAGNSEHQFPVVPLQFRPEGAQGDGAAVVHGLGFGQGDGLFGRQLLRFPCVDLGKSLFQFGRRQGLIHKEPSLIFDIGTGIDLNNGDDNFTFDPFKGYAVMQDLIAVSVRISPERDDITFQPGQTVQRPIELFAGWGVHTGQIFLRLSFQFQLHLFSPSFVYIAPYIVLSVKKKSRKEVSMDDVYVGLTEPLRPTERGQAPGGWLFGQVQRAGQGTLQVVCGGLTLDQTELHVPPGLDYAWTEGTGGDESLRVGDRLLVPMTVGGQDYYILQKAVFS